MNYRTPAGLFAALLVITCAANGVLSAPEIEMSDQQRAAIEERIKPVGEVCIEGDNNCKVASIASGAGAATAAVAAGGRSGEDIYNTSCLACHSTGAGGAPKLGDVAAWAERIAKGNDALYQSAIAGVAGTSMMAKGGCMNCSDAEIRASVDHLVTASQ